ncbi:MAG TPA: PQQ-binding-like beta-propeller repeat protein [Polyangia bacterium]|nr:PQQ-binding-like beta-propeller repeat protein [Polyangia bacterium]
MRRRRPRRSWAALLGALALVALLAPARARAAAPYDWPQFDGDARHSGNNTRETSLSAANVAQLQQLFQVTLPAVADGAPAVLASVSTSKWTVASGGTSPLVANGILYVAGPNIIQALSAATGAQLWHASIGGIHWESPVVANGVLYIMDEAQHLTAFTAPAAAPPVPAMPDPALWLTVTGLMLLGLHSVRGSIASAARASRRALAR